MAKELAHFKNFAKLKDTSLEFNDITVLAGKPSTGKSYVMKFMYAVNETFYRKKRDELINIEPYIKNLLSEVHYIESVTGYNLSWVDEYIKEKKFKELDKDWVYPNIFDNATIINENLKFILEKLNLPLENKITYYLNNLIKSIFTRHSQISEQYIVLFKDISFNYLEEEFNVKLNKNNFNKSINEPIFVETPLILEFKKFMPKEKGKTPYHIESILNILDTNYSFTDLEQEVFIQNFTKKSKEIISGDIESSGDSFVYRTDTRNYDILNTSSGTKSIGLLQYLVTNKALKKGSVLFWEEPEVHLHPQWQLKMVDLFVELMNAGVKIVFSTHSPYMADYLNAISQKRDFRDRVSFNVLEEKDGIVSNYILDDNNWNILQKELMDTFEDILWQYL